MDKMDWCNDQKTLGEIKRVLPVLRDLQKAAGKVPENTSIV